MKKSVVKKVYDTNPAVKLSFFQQADLLIAQSNGRVTKARTTVLAFLLQQRTAVSHQQIFCTQNGVASLDRVTLYRVLDWLIAQTLVHKVIGADRVWRFRANHGQLKHEQHAHFKCNQCATVICLHDVLAKKQALTLPDGYQGLEVELIVKGLCATCS
jgi:Fur family ferric uptake transcriptional regulator